MSNNNLAHMANDMLQNFENAELIFTPIVFPSNDNQNMAVVQCTFNRNKLSLSNFGVATAQEIGSNNKKYILDAASIDSLNKVKSIANSFPQIVDVEYTHITHETKQLPSANSDKSKLLGGGEKPISQNQIKFIDALCKKQRDNFDDVAKRVCGKNISELTGADANAIISELK